ncbi:hypothetical protein F442_13368 [Phytophthora nicotianae P10297]|uniref:Uncharacterized protein n=1 Tax=Phytophthora nicotianae P10297 TaxID=1317064 RepID=W2YVH4_PHYNI|nr:hypothetical protein F442_13368 [Phytophthora nicotianae P10297]
MNFLAEEDHTATLDEALAFIDSYELAQSSDSSFDSGDGNFHPIVDKLLTQSQQLPGADLTGETTPENPKQTTKRINTKSSTKKRQRGAHSSSTALQRRKRAELHSLRSQVNVLQDLLVEMKYACASCSAESSHSGQEPTEERRPTAMNTKPRTGQEEWYNHAVQQYRERLKVEVTNRRLKSLVEKHMKINESLCEVLQEGSLQRGMEFVLKTQTQVECPPLLELDQSIISMDLLLQRVDSFYLNSSDEFQVKNSPLALVNSMTKRYDEQRQYRSVVFHSTTPLECSVNDASAFLWRTFQSERIPGLKPDSLEKRVMFVVQSRTGPLHFDKQHYLRRFVEADRVVFVWGDNTVHPAAHTRLCVQGWATVAPLTAKSCMVISNLFLRLDCGKGGDTSGRGQDIAIGAIGSEIRKYWQLLQDAMIDEAASCDHGMRIAMP